MGYRLLIINPGSTSTKLAVYSRMPKSRTNEARIPYIEKKMD
jgi:butyrate kinase